MNSDGIRKMQIETVDAKRVKELATDWLAKNQIIGNTQQSREEFLSGTRYNGVKTDADGKEKHIVEVFDNTPFTGYIIQMTYKFINTNPEATLEEIGKEIDRQRAIMIQFAFAWASEERKRELLAPTGR